MKDLIERLEKATGPDQDLDEAIFDMAWPVKSRNGLTWRERGEQILTSDAITPRYTASIDAAMTLKPEGWCIDHGTIFWPGQVARVNLVGTLERRRGKEMIRCHTSCDGRAVGEHESSFAIALCIAALKAREQSK